MSSSSSSSSVVLEAGDVFFGYRPARGEDAPEGVADVQRFFIVLRPEGGERARRLLDGEWG